MSRMGGLNLSWTLGISDTGFSEKLKGVSRNMTEAFAGLAQGMRQPANFVERAIAKVGSTVQGIQQQSQGIFRDIAKQARKEEGGQVFTNYLQKTIQNIANISQTAKEAGISVQGVGKLIDEQMGDISIEKGLESSIGRLTPDTFASLVGMFSRTGALASTKLIDSLVSSIQKDPKLVDVLAARMSFGAEEGGAAAGVALQKALSKATPKGRETIARELFSKLSSKDTTIKASVDTKGFTDATSQLRGVLKGLNLPIRNLVTAIGPIYLIGKALLPIINILESMLMPLFIPLQWHLLQLGIVFREAVANWMPKFNQMVMELRPSLELMVRAIVRVTGVILEGMRPAIWILGKTISATAWVIEGFVKVLKALGILEGTASLIGILVGGFFALTAAMMFSKLVWVVYTFAVSIAEGAVLAYNLALWLLNGTLGVNIGMAKMSASSLLMVAAATRGWGTVTVIAAGAAQAAMMGYNLAVMILNTTLGTNIVMVGLSINSYKFLIAVKRALGVVVGFLPGLYGKLRDAIAMTTAAEKLNAFWTKIVTAATKIWGVVSSATAAKLWLLAAATTAYNFSLALLARNPIMIALLALVSVGLFVYSVWDKLNTVFKYTVGILFGLSAAITAVGVAMLLLWGNPILLVVGGIGLLITSIATLVGWIYGKSPGLIPGFRLLGSVGVEAFGLIVSAGRAVVETITGVFGGLWDGLSSIWGVVQAGSQALFGGIKESARGTLGILSEFGVVLSTGFVSAWETISGVATAGLRYVRNMFEGAWDYIVGFFKAMPRLFDPNSWASVIRDWVTSIVTSVLDWGKELVKRGTGKVADFGVGIGKNIVGSWEKTKDFLVSGGKNVATMAQGMGTIGTSVLPRSGLDTQRAAPAPRMESLSDVRRASGEYGRASLSGAVRELKERETAQIMYWAIGRRAHELADSFWGSFGDFFDPLLGTTVMEGWDLAAKELLNPSSKIFRKMESEIDRVRRLPELDPSTFTNPMYNPVMVAPADTPRYDKDQKAPKTGEQSESVLSRSIKKLTSTLEGVNNTQVVAGISGLRMSVENQVSEVLTSLEMQQSDLGVTKVEMARFT